MNQHFEDVSFLQLDIFVHVVDSGSFTKAADMIHITQSAVSKNVEKLEQRLDLKLFTRDHKNIYITEAGSEFYQIARKTMENLTEEYERIWSLQHGQKSKLRIGIVNNTDLEQYYWPIWTQFQRRFPEASAEYESESLSNMMQMLISHKLDMIFVPDFMAQRLEQLHLPWKWAAKDHARVVVPKGHPLESREISFQTLKEFPIVLLSDEETFNLQYMKQVFQDAGVDLKVGKQYTSPDNICRFYTANDGVLLTDVFFDCSRFHEPVTKLEFPEMDAGIIVSWNPKAKNDYVNNFIKIISASNDR